MGAVRAAGGGHKQRDRVIAHLTEKGIPNMVYYPTPQHALPVFRDEPTYGETFRNANDYCARDFLPAHAPLSDGGGAGDGHRRGFGGAVMAEKAYFVHESSCIDDDVEIGEGTKIWHFCHIQRGARIGKRCSLGQNVNVSNHVKIGDGCKIQNNVSLYEGVELENDVFCRALLRLYQRPHAPR